jgi:hypothetical protein
MKKLLILVVALLALTSCSPDFKPSDIAPNMNGGGNSVYVFTEMTNTNQFEIRVYEWTVNPLNGNVKQQAADYLAKKFPGSAVYNESQALVVITYIGAARSSE